MSNEVQSELAVAVAGALKSAPPVAVSGLTVWGYPVADWVCIATLLWIAIQAGGWAYDRFVKPKRGAQ